MMSRRYWPAVMRVIVTDARQLSLQHWLASELGHQDARISIASADASFRRYLRVDDNGRSLIVMDAPPEHEDCGPFIDVAHRLRQAGVNAPEVLATDLRHGFLLLTDLGDQLYSHALNVKSADALYERALSALHDIQKIDSSSLPAYDQQLLNAEMALFKDWLLGKHLELELSSDEQTTLHNAFALLCDQALKQRQVFVHRDYHCRNLMVTENNSPGVLDFQDAVRGPITYDLVSLLRDCYVRWPNAWVERWSEGYRSLFAPDVDSQTWRLWFDWMGVQRHLKAAGIFARLNYRDGKSGYLADVPRTVQYILEVCSRYQALEGLAELVRSRVMPALETQTRKAS